MSEQNQIRKPVLMVFFTIIILIAASYIPAKSSVFGVEIKEFDILGELKPEESSSDEYEYDYEEMIEDDDFWNNDGSMIFEQNQINQASLGFESAAANLYGYFFTGENAVVDKVGSFTAQIKHEKLSGNTKQLKPFFDALKKSNKEQVRIAHYGDSIIGGDLITQNIRDNLQKKFGGDAAGFLAIASEDVKFRMTTKHTFDEDDWKTVKVYSNLRKLPIGINTNVYTPKGKTAIEYEITNHFPRLNGFTEVKLYYSDAQASSINYKFDNNKTEVVKLKEGSDVQELVLKSNGIAKKIRIEITQKDQAYFYGVSLENGNGVYIDNFSMQGRSGATLVKIPQEQFEQFDKYLGYDLIVLQFGLNVIGKIEKDPKRYEKDMIEVVEHLQKSFPKTGIVLMGVNDKGFKKGTEITTDPSVKRLLSIQMNVVKKTNIAFWNLFEAMGGENSMEEWVKANPPLAWGDYTHFNNQGAEKVAELFSDALIDAYNSNK
ncbi:MAG: hypothetical protein K9J12_13385 [Melioribacteraceae bacterium]|nr:hypothetical protein [Melioribacteraceae bacterium]MCF8412835.1 hypothetical protein [Melioribacteraceae bacterium]MCF8431314.1 hypothetical protein [Melioribacteraceae bacterium]